MPRQRALTCLLFSAFFLASCSDAAPEIAVDRVDPDALFSDQIQRVVFEVDYMPGAEPYAVEFQEGNGIWGIFRDNVKAIFLGQNKELVFPESLDDMTVIEGIEGEKFSVAQIVDIAAAYRNLHIEGDQLAIYILYLDGYYDDGSEARDDVLGLNMGETGIIAMFKPVIESTGVGAKGNTAVFVEQATLSHEFGHAVGLVGRAIAVVSDHHDAENGNHCSNSDCLMHVSNEGATAMKAFTQKLQDGGNRVLFGPACLADAREAAGLPPQAPANPPAGPPGPPGQQP